MTMTVDDLIKRAKQVRGSQSSWWPLWDDLARVMVPRLLGFAETVVPGQSRMDEIFDGTPMQAARGLANAIQAMCRPDGFVTIKAEEDELNDHDEARVWLEDANERFKNALDNPKARVRDVWGASDLSLVVFGTGPFYIGEADSLRHLMFRSVHLKDAGIDWDEEADAYAMYRFRRYTARQAESRFGFASLGETAQEHLKSKKYDALVDYIHAVVPRRDRMIEGVFAKNLPYASYWIEEKSKHQVAEGGFHEFPFIIPRMETAPGEEYGRSPGMVALPDANTLQAMGETLLTAGQKAAEPPLMAPNDGSFSEANTYPGGISYYDVSIAAKVRGNPVFPLQTGGNIPLTREMQMDVRDQIYRAFFKNILNLPVDGPEMTATEIHARREEFLREVGPMFGRLETNDTAPACERAFMVMLRAGGFAPPPPILANQNLRFEYESPVKRIRKQIEAAAAQAWTREVIQISAVKPEAIDILNADEYLRFQHDAAKVPEKLINTDETIASLREARAQQQEMQAKMAAVQQGAEIANTAADAASTAGLLGTPKKAA